MNDIHLVTKSNTLINSHYDLSVEEQRIILTLASMVQPTDCEFKAYKFKISEFMELLGIKDKSKYTIVPKITKALMQKVFEIRQDNKIIQVAWLCSAEYIKGSGTVELEFSPKLKPYMLGLKEFYTSYRLKNILELKGKYSIRLYEILKSNEYKKVQVINLDELKEILKADTETYSIYQNFKKRIIEPSQKELEKKTDIKFEYEEIKTGKKITALKFTINTNKMFYNQNNTSLELNELNMGLLDAASSNEDSSDLIDQIKDEFKRLYKGTLVDKFVQKMIEKKGMEHVRKCLAMYDSYIKGRSIDNIAGDFYKFVTEGYEKPIKHRGNVMQRDNFEQREYSDEEYERFYANLTE